MYNFTPLQKEHLIQWAEWLETTELDQGVESLKRNEMEEVWDDSPMDEDVDALPIFLDEQPTGPSQYCCLGVYVEMRNPSYFTSCDEFSGEWLCSYRKKVKFKDYNTSYLPNAMAREIGAHRNKLQDAFITMNDDLRYNFKEIAEEIRCLAATGNFSEEVQERLGE